MEKQPLKCLNIFGLLLTLLSLTSFLFLENVKYQFSLKSNPNKLAASKVLTTHCSTSYIHKNPLRVFIFENMDIEEGIITNNVDFGKYLLDMTKGAQGNDGQLFSLNRYDMLFADQLTNGVVLSDFVDNHGVFWIKDNNILRYGGNDLGGSDNIKLR